ncbi:MAG: CDP-alcohol phosphatidyltransferase family protein, partial [Acidobacteriota bacterium]
GGTNVESRSSVREAVRLLVRGSGKPTDGIFSNFNRSLCRPAVRWLLKTPITANMITFLGLLVAVASGYAYSRGHWAAYAVGGLLFFIAVEFDEMDGMLARTKFQESPFGCWLETYVDYMSYLFLLSGMTIGLYREHGAIWLLLGAMTLLGCVTSFFLFAKQRKLATRPERPEEYLIRFYRRLEQDSDNFLSQKIRRYQFIIKKGVLCHGVFWFSVLGALQVFVALGAFISNVTWIAVLYTNHLFRSPGNDNPADNWEQPAGSLPTR